MTELKEFYNIPDNVEVILAYFGNHIFKLQSVKQIDVSTSIPSFHSRSNDSSNKSYSILPYLQTVTNKMNWLVFYI